jgi:hypothetical protein
MIFATHLSFMIPTHGNCWAAKTVSTRLILHQLLIVSFAVKLAKEQRMK